MSDPAPWVAAARHSHDHLTQVVAGLDPGELSRPSACSEWTVAQVLSHLGSQAEIFSLLVDAGISGGAPPSPEAFGPIWDTWNALSPEEQAKRSTEANEALVSRLEALDAETLDGFHLEVFGRNLDAAGLVRMRLGEHAVHAWDVAVVFDPSAEVAGDAVELLIDGLGEVAGRAGKVPAEPFDTTIITTEPGRQFRLRTGDSVTLESIDATMAGSGSIQMPADAFLRLVYGRLDETHPSHGSIEADGVSITDLTTIFPGF